MKVLIIGGVACGASTGARLRRLDEDAEIIIFERGDYISYANCGLPYYVGDVINKEDNLLLMNPSLMKKRFNIDVRVNSEVLKIDRDNKKLLIQDNEKEYEETYDYLVIATGSHPFKPNIEGIESDLIKTIWTVNDSIKIKNMIIDQDINNISVVGGGFIGLEMMENIKNLNKEVNLIEASNQVMPPIDIDMANIIHKHIRDNNINLYLNDGVKAFKEIDNKIEITLNSDKKIISDLVILAIGVKPNNKLALDAGLEVNQRGGIVVDEYMKTSDEYIYAGGDVVEVENYINKEKTMIPLAGPANKQGRIIADNLAGLNSKYHGSLGTSIAKVFDLTIASTGLNEKNIKEEYKSIIIRQNSHASYYPHSNPMYIKLLFKEDGKILGCQIVGKDGVDKRIDVVSTVIRMNGSIEDLKELELAYAPPFNAAKDPINMAGFVASNVLDKQEEYAKYDEIENNKEYLLLDVRTNREFDHYHIENSIHIPLEELRERINELDINNKYIIMCAAGVRAHTAAQILRHKGFKDTKVYPGGISFYIETH